MAEQRKEMVEYLERGISVLHNGRVISSVADLPSEADLAAGDEEASKIALEGLDEKIRVLEAEKAKLNPKQDAVKKVVDKLNEDQKV